MKKKLKRVSTQKDLSRLIYELSKDNYFSGTSKECGILSVNDSASVSKAVSDTIQSCGYGNDFLTNIINGIDKSKCKDAKKSLAIEIVCFIFRDAERWYIFSQSKKMMTRVIKNDKTPI